jgi:hypothetical protein
VIPLVLVLSQQSAKLLAPPQPVSATRDESAYIRFEQHNVVIVKVLVGFRVALKASPKAPALEGSFHQLLTFYDVQGVFKYCQNLPF